MSTLKFADPNYHFSPSQGVFTADVRSIYHPDLIDGATRRRKSHAKYVIGLIAIFFIISVAAFIHSLPPRSPSAQTALAAPAVAAAPVVEAASGGIPVQEVHVAADGLVLLRAAKVLSVNGTMLTLETGWGASNFIWTITTNISSSGTHNYGTQVIDLKGQAVGLANIQSGSLVTVTGMLDQNSQNPAVAADTIRILN